MTKKDLRIIFMGTPEFAVGTLKELVENEYNVVAVVTQPDKPVGRHQNSLQPSAVKQFALENNIPVLQPIKMKDPAFVEELRSYKADLQVVVAFRMLPEIVWAMPRFGTFNVHAALLPQYRGAAPINWAVINGETQTGVTTFFLDHDIDTGRIIMQDKFDIDPDHNVEDVYNGLMKLGAKLAVKTINKIIDGDGEVESLPQSELYKSEGELHPAPKIFKDICKIDWNQPAWNIHNFIRGLSPYPGAWTTIVDEKGNERILKIFQTKISSQESMSEAGSFAVDEKNKLLVNTCDNQIELVKIQLSGKPRVWGSDFVNGHNVSLMKIVK